jgi:imidazolonepropionase-like amidohydrolase
MAVAETVRRIAREERGLDPEIRLVENPRAGETLVEQFEVDTSRIREELGWEPRESVEATVRDLLQEDVLVSLGQDDVSDAYYPYGRNNMLEVAFLVSHLLWMTSRADIQQLYDMITTKAARCMGLQDFELKPGAPANLVVLQAPTVLEALRTHAAPAHVISHGRLVDLERMRQVAETRRW